MLREWSDLPSDKDRSKARALFGEIERLSSKLAEVQVELNQLTGQQNAQRIAATPDVAALLLKARRQRDKLLPGLFGEPAWDILLSLAALKPADQAVPVSSIGYAAEVPQATALRYLALLETAGFVERTQHPSDRRSVLIRLTEEGRERLQRLLEKWPLAVVLVAAPLTLLFKLFLG